MDQSNLKKIATVREMILGAVALLMLTFLFFSYIYTPRNVGLSGLYDKIKTLEAEKNTLKKQTEELKKQKQTKKTVPAKSADIRLDILNRAVKPEIDSVGKLLQVIAQPDFQRGIIITSVGSVKSQATKGYIRFPFQLRAVGSFAQITRFLENLRDLSGLVSVDSLVLEMESDSKGEINLDMMLTFYNVEGYL